MEGVEASVEEVKATGGGGGVMKATALLRRWSPREG